LQRWGDGKRTGKKGGWECPTTLKNVQLQPSVRKGEGKVSREEGSEKNYIEKLKEPYPKVVIRGEEEDVGKGKGGGGQTNQKRSWKKGLRNGGGRGCFPAQETKRRAFQKDGRKKRGLQECCYTQRIPSGSEKERWVNQGNWRGNKKTGVGREGGEKKCSQVGKERPYRKKSTAGLCGGEGED